MAKKKNKNPIPTTNPIDPPKFKPHEDDWVPLVSPHTAPEIIWCVRGKCDRLLTGKNPWMYAWDYLRMETHEFWQAEAEHKAKMKQLKEEMNNPKYNGKRKSK